MRLFLFLIVVVIFAWGCKKKSCNASYGTYTFETNKQLVDSAFLYLSHTVHTYLKRPGTDLVFTADYGELSCDPYPGSVSTYLSFQINSSLNSFEYKDSTILLTTKCNFWPNSDPPLSFPTTVTTGTIKGSKLTSKKWHIMAQIPLRYGESISFDRLFTLSQ